MNRLQRRYQQHRVVHVQGENVAVVLGALVSRNAVNNGGEFVLFEFAIHTGAQDVVDADGERLADLVSSEVRTGVVYGN